MLLNLTNFIEQNCFLQPRKKRSSSFELFVLSIMQEDVHTLRESSCSVCESSIRLGHRDG